MLIRRATQDDAEAMFQVHRAAVNAFCSEAYSPEHMAKWFLGRTARIYEESLAAGRLWLAEAEGRVLGFVEAVPDEVTLLFVAPEARGNAVGAALLERGIQQATGSNACAVTVIATKNSVSFYQRHGFQVVGEQFFGRGEPELQYPVVKMVREPVPHGAVAATDA